MSARHIPDQHSVEYGTRPHRTLRDRLRTIYYLGLTYRCPFCGFRSRDWSPIGWDLPVLEEKQVAGAGRRKAGCFNCGSNDRERLIHTYLEREGLLTRMPTLRVLHIAPEITLREYLLHRNKPREYVIGDKKTAGYAYPPEVVDLDATELPLADSHFDVVICNHVLEHIPDDRLAMAEIHRVLAPGGTAILQVPYAWGLDHTEEDLAINDPRERERRYGQFDHVRLYGRDYEDRLREVGFEVMLLRMGKDPALRTLGLSPTEPLVVAKKHPV